MSSINQNDPHYFEDQSLKDEKTTKDHANSKEVDKETQLFTKTELSTVETPLNVSLKEYHPNITPLDFRVENEVKDIQNVAGGVQIASPNAPVGTQLIPNVSSPRIVNSPQQIEEKRNDLEVSMSFYDFEGFKGTVTEALNQGFTANELFGDNIIEDAREKKEHHPEFIELINTYIPQSSTSNVAPKANARKEIEAIISSGDVNKFKDLFNNYKLSTLRTEDFDPLLLALNSPDNKEMVCLIAKHLGINIDLKNINKPDETGVTPFIRAISIDINLIPFLIENGADVNARDKEGNTPLLLVIKKGDREDRKIIEFLLQKKVPINVYNNKGFTPLCYAALHSDKIYSAFLTKSLLEAGANPTLLTTTGESPSDWASLKKNTEASKLLEKAAPGFAKVWKKQHLLMLRFTTDPIMLIDNNPTKITGSRYEFTYPELQESLKSNWAANLGSIPKKAAPEWNEDDTKAVMEAIGIGLESVLNPTDKIINLMLQHIKNGGVLSIPTGWENHAVGVVISKNMVIKCNRGDRTLGESGADVYQLTEGKEFEEAKLRQVISRLVRNRELPENREFFEKEMTSELGLPASFVHLPHKDQYSGNCPWASAKLMFRAAIYAQAAKKDPVNADKISREMYKQWSRDDRKAALNNFLETLKEFEGKSPTMMSREETLSIILKRSANYPEIAESVLSELKLPQNLKASSRAFQLLDKGGFILAFSREELERQLNSNPIMTPIVDADLKVWVKERNGTIKSTEIIEFQENGKFTINLGLTEFTAVDLKDYLDLRSFMGKSELKNAGCKAGDSYEASSQLYWQEPPLTPILFPNNQLFIRDSNNAKAIIVEYIFNPHNKKFRIKGKDLPEMTAQELITTITSREYLAKKGR